MRRKVNYESLESTRFGLCTWAFLRKGHAVKRVVKYKNMEESNMSALNPSANQFQLFFPSRMTGRTAQRKNKSNDAVSPKNVPFGVSMMTHLSNDRV